MMLGKTGIFMLSRGLDYRNILLAPRNNSSSSWGKTTTKKSLNTKPPQLLLGQKLTATRLLWLN